MSEPENINENEWVDEIAEQLEDLMADYKCAKFNTHKNRKNFFGEVKSLIHKVHRDFMEKKNHTYHNLHNPVITHPNPNSQRGFAVMDESLSEKGDAVLGVGPGNSTGPTVPALKEQIKRNAGLRRW